MVVVPARTETWTYVDGDWHEGNVAVAGPLTHAFWQGSSVFDGARAVDGLTPDVELHFERVNASARALGMEPTHSVDDMLGLLKDGLAKFQGSEPIYIRPMYWADNPGFMGVPCDPASTRFLLCLYETPMNTTTGMALGLSSFRRPTFETAPTNAKAGCLYPNNARAIMEARNRGFDNAIVLDMLGNVAESGLSNLFLVKDGIVRTPQENGTFLAGITRHRSMTLLRDAGFVVEETTLRMDDFLNADEVFSSGNHSKIMPVTRIEGHEMQLGPTTARVRDLYWDWARQTSAQT
ncbi:MAG: branched-chain amino acid aminotransferase [Pseudomonadota bacterium]